MVDAGPAQEVLSMCGTASHEHPRDITTDLYLSRDPEEIEKEDQATAGKPV